MVDNRTLIRSGEAQLVGWSRSMLYSGFNILHRSVFWSAYFNGRSDNLDVIPLNSTIGKKMELGGVCGEVFFEITRWSLLIAAVISIALRFYRRIPIIWLVALFLGLSYLLTSFGNDLFHQKIFAERHQAQNEIVPQQGCTSYRPSFMQLYATYTMSRERFEEWVETHSWPILPAEIEAGEIYDNDTRELGFASPELYYATEMLGNGKQLRVYFKNNVMYLSYNSM